MPEPAEWNPLLATRRRLREQPDDETVQVHMEGWKAILALDDETAEPLLDHELVKLLEKIHHDF